MPVSALQVIALAEADVGRVEVPPGSNRSTWLDPIQRRVSEAHGWAASFLIGQPWCGTWAYDVAARAGFDHADNPFHPSTAAMWSAASADGTLTGDPVPGCAIVWNGVHTGIVVAVDRAAGVVHTIEGNSGDQVARRVRPIAGTHRYIVPRVLVQSAPVQVLHWLQDLAAKYRVVGPWAKESSARRRLALMLPRNRRRSAVLRTGDGRWVIRVGEPRNYGPWAAKASRDNAQTVLERRLGRRLRRFLTKRRVSPGATIPAGAAEALGKTT